MSGRDTKILIVDDEATIIFAMKAYFKSCGYQVDCAQEMEEAEALLAVEHYEVVIADLRLTGVHGVEGLEIIGFVRERCPGTRIILLTAYKSPMIEVEAQRRGAHRVLSKPQQLPALNLIVQELLTIQV